jgi:hypothetical protein
MHCHVELSSQPIHLGQRTSWIKMMINERIKSLPAGEIRDLLEELEQVTGLSVEHHRDMNVHSFLTLCLRDVIHDKRQTIQAANFYRGSLLKVKVGKIAPGEVTRLVEELCDLYRVHREMVATKSLYVFINQIMNPKSQLRKPPPIRL